MASKEIKEGRKVFFWWSAGHVMSVTFHGFVRMRMGTGRSDTNKIGTGLLVGSETFPPYNLKYKKLKISPYHDFYLTARSAYNRRNAIKRPAPNNIL